MIKKIFQIFGGILILCGIIFLLVNTFFVTKTTGESFIRDIFGFRIPEPPIWTSYIPYVGSFIGFLFEFFSLHGLLSLIVLIIFVAMGSFMFRLGENIKNTPTSSRNKQELVDQHRKKTESALMNLNKEMKRKYNS